MAYDKTPPRDKMILGMAVLCIGTLIGLMPLLRMYFYSVMTPIEEGRAASAGLTQVNAYRDEQTRATSGIQDAMRQFAAGSRSPAIAPTRGDQPNIDAVEGWSELKNEEAAAHARAAYTGARAREAAEAMASVDGGVPAAPGVTP